MEAAIDPERSCPAREQGMPGDLKTTCPLESSSRPFRAWLTLFCPGTVSRRFSVTTVSGFATRARPAALPSPHPRRCPHPPSSSAVADPVGIGRAGRCRTLAAVPRTGLFRVGGSSRLVPRGRGTRRWIVLGFQPRRTSRSGARRALGRTRFHAHLASGPLHPPQRHPRLLRNALWRHVGCQQDAHISSLAVVVHRFPLPQGPQGQPPSEGG